MKHAARYQLVKSVCVRALSSGILLSLLFLLVASFADAQSTSGRIRGTVTDASGSAVVAATVTLINTSTNGTRDTATNSTGEYSFLEVPIGSYEINVNQQGFKKFVRKDISVDLNAVLSVDIALQVGGSTEVVEVTGAPPIIDTTSTQLGAVVDERSVTQLPLNARDTYQLLQLQPGVQSQVGNDLFYGSNRAGVVTVNGGRGRANNYTINGGDGNDLFANIPTVQPSPDTIEEFKVITNSFDAEYGRNSGSVVNVVTKSGTNAFHGDFYEFFRNATLNSKGFYDVDKPQSIQNQFGATLGGPIKKDKTFFFASYEGRRVKKGISSTPVPVPSPEELAGDFSSVTQGQFAGMLYDRTTATMLQSRCGNSVTGPAANALAAAASGTPTPYAQIFPNSQVPTPCFDPVSQALVTSYVPAANAAGNIRQVVPNSFDNGNQFQVHVDHEWSPKQKTSVYYYYDNGTTIDPFANFQAAGGNLGNFPGLTNTIAQQVNVTHTSTIGSTMVNEARFTYFREAQPKFNQPKLTSAIGDSCGVAVDPSVCFGGTLGNATLVDSNGDPLGSNPDYGIHPNLGAQYEGLPFISVGSGFSVGNNFEGQLPQTGNTYQLADNFSKIIGTHSLKFGGDFRIQQFDQTLYYNVNGYYNFNSTYNVSTDGTGNPCFTFDCVQANYPSGNDVGAGDSYPNFLLGLPYSYSQGSAQQELVRSKSLYLFAQDSWKIRSNLTLNYGLRWELNTPLTDIGHKVQTFRPGQLSTIYPCALPTTDPLYDANAGITDCNSAGVTPVGLVFPGDKGVPMSLTNTYYHAFAPRLGLNWSPGWTNGVLGAISGGPGRMTVSAGWGMFYNPIEQLVLEQFSAEPPFGGSNYITNPLFETPFVDQSGATYPNPFNGILNPPRGTPINWETFRSILLYGQFPSQLRSQYSDQYNLTIKRQLPDDILFQIGYVGSQGHRLLASYDLNHGNPQSCNDLNAVLGAGTCGPYGADSPYYIPATATIPSGGITLPYGGPNGGPYVFLPGGGNVGANNNGNGITLVGLRQYSSPLCQPLTGTGCPVDGVPVFSNIFTENTIAHSNYNSLQAMLQKNFSKGLQFQASYTYSKSLDNASSFENALNPINFNATYGPSLYDARHRLVFSYVWELPVPKMEGFKGALLNGWQMSGIVTWQTGFPIRITSNDDIEQFSSLFFEAPGEPNLVAPFRTQNARKNGGYVFDSNLFSNDPNAGGPAYGTIGNAPRSLCCSPGINNWDMGFFKGFNLGEKLRAEFRTEIYNVWNHTQLYSVDGNISDIGGTFGQALHAREPREIQFALKFLF
jgi:Carboxypeptidase regulatory-like domain